jgi:oxygen-independent coproporphyrinogen III oxidase
MLENRHATYDRPVPRYTSYPTAPHFHAGIGPDAYGAWLATLAPTATLSLYLHLPFCDRLCWYCGCHTKIVARYDPVARYRDLLLAEIDLVADRLGARRRALHVHFGGGTPTLLEPDDFLALIARLRGRFAVDGGTEIAVEIDPRSLDADRIAALAEGGVTRASLGVQDLNPDVQAAVNRIQPFSQVAAVVGALRASGIGSINLDLMYGLPRQDEAAVLRTVEGALRLEPDRIALFGYAHVPWMKPHQRLIDEAALPDGPARARQAKVAAERLVAAGYDWIGLDHFARPGDPLARARREGRLRRNFQGYTTDQADALLGFGASAIGALPEGYVQNAVPIRTWQGAIAAGRLATARGLALDDDDRLRRAVIERLMCDLAVDLDALARPYGADGSRFTAELAALAAPARDGLVRVEAGRVTVLEAGRPYLRTIAAVFDARLAGGVGRHSRAV